MSVPVISFAEGEAALDWRGLTDALAAGHTRPKAQIGDTFLYRDPDTILSRAAWIDGMGAAVKTATVFPNNPARGAPMINGGVNLYADEDGALAAIIDFHLVTKWKTAGDSLLAALKLAPPQVRRILIVGAGAVGASVREAFAAGFPGAGFAIWNRSAARAEALAQTYPETDVAEDLAHAVHEADIIIGCTMSTEPWLRGEWLRPGQHVNLIGAYRPDMREADDTALQRATLYVDSLDTTLDHIGELKIPLKAGVITRENVRADYYSLDSFAPEPSGVTLFKNGGGAHLDLMTAHYILSRWSAQ